MRPRALVTLRARSRFEKGGVRLGWVSRAESEGCICEYFGGQVGGQVYTTRGKPLNPRVSNLRRVGFRLLSQLMRRVAWERPLMTNDQIMASEPEPEPPSSHHHLQQHHHGSQKKTRR